VTAVNSGISRNLAQLRDRPDEVTQPPSYRGRTAPAGARTKRRIDMDRRKLVLLIAVVTAALASLGPAAAAAPARVAALSGGYNVTAFGETTCAPVPGDRLECRTTGLEATYDGSLVGRSTARFVQLIDCAAGRTVGHGTETFVGSVGGRTGTLTWSLVLTSDFDCTTFFPSNLRIVAVVTRGTGGLLGSRGLLLFDDTSYRGVVT
jgi:hypothetical protein